MRLWPPYAEAACDRADSDSWQRPLPGVSSPAVICPDKHSRSRCTAARPSGTRD